MGRAEVGERARGRERDRGEGEGGREGERETARKEGGSDSRLRDSEAQRLRQGKRRGEQDDL